MWIDRINKRGDVWITWNETWRVTNAAGCQVSPPHMQTQLIYRVRSQITFSTQINWCPMTFYPNCCSLHMKCNGWQKRQKKTEKKTKKTRANEWRMRQKEDERVGERMPANRLFQAPMQEQMQQPTLPWSIRVIEREGWRGGEGRGGKEGVEREERNSHVDEPICLIGHGEGGREVAWSCRDDRTRE